MIINSKIKNLIKDLNQNPTLWFWDDDTIYKPGNMRNTTIWDANGFFFFGFFPKLYHLNIFEKFILKRAITKYKKVTNEINYKPSLFRYKMAQSEGLI